MASELDPARGQPHSGPMSASFDTLAAADALRAVGMESGHARAIATQLRAASGAGDAVTRPELEAALAKFKTELLERMADTKTELLERIADGEAALMERIAKGEAALMGRIEKGEAALMGRIAKGEAALMGRIEKGERRTANLRTELLERIAQSERHQAVLLWRLFAGIAAVVAASNYLL